MNKNYRVVSLDSFGNMRCSSIMNGEDVFDFCGIYVRFIVDNYTGIRVSGCVLTFSTISLNLSIRSAIYFIPSTSVLV